MTKKAPKKTAKKATKKKSKIGKMKAYESFDAWAKDQIEEWQEPIIFFRKLITTDFKMLTEFVKWGNGCWTLNDIPVCYMYGGYTDHVQFGFFGGSALKDPKGLLQGEGKFIRSLRFKTKKDIDKAYVTKLIRQAVKNVKAMKD